MKLQDIFSVFEEEKERYKIDKYSIKQATLEQIFNTFAKGGDLVSHIPTTTTELTLLAS